MKIKEIKMQINAILAYQKAQTRLNSALAAKKMRH